MPNVAALLVEGGGDEGLTVCLVSLCDGIGGGRVAVGAFTCQVSMFIVEKEAYLRDFVSGAFPGTRASDLVETLDVQAVLAFISEANADVTLLFIGPPCPPFSGLSSDPRGFDDARCAALKAFVSVKDQLRAGVSQADGRQFHWLLEEVASMSVAHRRQISDLLGCEPVLVNAADWGWVQRSRL